ncbi:hypothetical protein SAMN04488066_102246 [Halorubrum aquaticum]|uniref:Uncharacterized protein n=1 Tax=Halorubrum aquaticum TaxID=387340 RepID=A0A1I2ZLE5_9EURY|nr:hypothetical protein [Halorubrum aquaticum]SFH38648.1 hypothetical protein SAMN04488066_102246 [Halorubrum aquaticum]
MPDPLGDAARRRLTEAATNRLAARGYDVSRPETRAEPPALAVRGEEALGIEPLTEADATPTTVVSRLGHALDRDRRALFVVADAAVADAVRSFLTDPPLLVAESDGRRTFHAGPDRIPVDTGGIPGAAGGYACVRVDDLAGRESGIDADPAFRWRETDTPVGPVPSVAGVDSAAIDPDGRPAVPRLICEVDDRPVAVLGGTESLRTPPSEAFPYVYRRDPADKRFRVRRGDDGTVVETVSGFAPMRAAGYVPVPMPLVPEHVVGPDVDVDEAWDLVVGERIGGG